MSAASYAPVATGQSKEPSSPLESPSSIHLTPDSDSEDDGAAVEFDAEAGIELKQLDHGEGRADAGAEISDNEADALVKKRKRRESAQSFELYTPDEDKAVRRKLDTHLVLFVALLYLLSFLDRSNIGNAKVAGLSKDLDLSDSQYSWLLTAFYISYILFEWMTVMYQLVPPHIYISVCVCAWGILASLQSLATSFGYLVVLRALLGIGEAAFVGIPFYLTFFFKREELAFRTGIFVSAAPLATSFASTLAWGIVALGDRTGVASWRLLFLVEGFPAVLVAVWCWVWVPDSPATARWLTPRERKVATLRLRRETVDAGPDGDEKAFKTTRSMTLPRHKKKFQLKEVAKTLADPKSYLTAAMFFCCNVAFSSMPVFLPTIINSMGFSKLASQGLSAPPFLFAFFAVLITALLSDRWKSRSIPMVFHALLAMTGYVVLTVLGVFQVTSPALRYAAIFPICAGFFSAVTVVITWTVNNQRSDEGKGTGMAVLNVIGQMGPLVGTRLYPDSEGPFYVKGMSVCAGAMGCVAVLALALRWVLVRENRRERGRRKGGEGGWELML
ncbi:hypothetical protein B0A48_09799 [Cryoendolithus antarcticus]|uniref:Major facilitator superfamily (MFS) profile domain-containing protein n=1 Tax=Cryoendolithus antarcticus TaxID=1507870 RepID=A0A1V8T2R2_9PEZI|nr:hypothetical protein B0A48_09799 [Cryoendolithus antarcticus]